MDNTSGVGVIDKSVALLDAVSAGPASLAQLVEQTSIPRPTAHRLALALERHRLLARDDNGHFVIGTRVLSWGSEVDPLLSAAQQTVMDLRDRTGVSAQVYRRHGEHRLCLAAAEPSSGLRDGVPVGALLSMKAGSAAQVLTAWVAPEQRADALRGAAFSGADLERTRKRGWAHSVGQREPGVASISAPVRAADGDVIAAVCVSAPAGRLAKPTADHIAALLDAASSLATAAAH